MIDFGYLYLDSLLFGRGYSNQRDYTASFTMELPFKYNLKVVLMPFSVDKMHFSHFNQDSNHKTQYFLVHLLD